MLGKDEEINLVKELNQKKNLELWGTLWLDHHNHRAVLVDIKVYSSVSEELVLPKSDLYIAKGDIDNEYLEKNWYVLLDSLVWDKLEFIPWYWISVKLKWSSQYTITKMTPNTFFNVFWNYDLWAWASIYCQNLEELQKNKSVILWWKTNIQSFCQFFSEKWIPINESDFELNNELSKIKFSKIKVLSNNLIVQLIDSNKAISDFIFNGKWAFDEPYCSSWIYHHWILTTDTREPYSVTTWSWRSKWVFTVVIKPLNKPN